MFISVRKHSNANKWHYPTDHKLFTNGFFDPNDSQQLIVTNNSGKTLAELTALAGYAIVEYTGIVEIITGIRTISARAFRRRFTELERKNIRKSQVDGVQDVKESLDYAIEVRLDHPLLIADLNTLVSNSIISNERKAELRTDGVEDESL